MFSYDSPNCTMYIVQYTLKMWTFLSFENSYFLNIDQQVYQIVVWMNYIKLNYITQKPENMVPIKYQIK